MEIRNIVLFMIFLCTPSYVLFSKTYYTGHEKVFVTGSFESPNSYISYVTIHKRRYIIKQKKDGARQIMAVIREALASYIAKDLKIAQSVQIIQAHDPIPGKMYPSSPATLHTLAPGEMVSELHGHKYFLLCLKQRDAHGKKITGKWLTDIIIDQITWHKHLALIIALDLFISNTDRNRRNIFYDELTDSFCAIDMENIYRRNVATMACQKLHEMIYVHEKKFTQQEVEALGTVKYTLEFLLKKYPPYKIIARFDKYAALAGYVQDDSFLSKKLTKKMEKHKRMISETYESVRTLVGMLEDIINNFDK